MRLGVSWYPEQHPQERWADDVRRMADAGLEVVRLGEFAWAVLEPQRDRFEWAWLDRAIELARDAGLEVVLGTPTAAPPVWLALERPEIRALHWDGLRRPYGGRKFTCPTVPAYREESRRIAAALAERYGAHPAVRAWQLDNEPGHRGSARCWCDWCERAFTDWLGRRYGSVEALNEAWGTVFWGATYPSLEAVRLPRSAIATVDPALLLAHRRFCSDMVVAAMSEQHAIVAPHAPGRPVFVNLPAHGVDVDDRAVAAIGSAAAINLYPTGLHSRESASFLLDLARGHSGRAWIMEHQPGPINWTPARDPVADGAVRLWGWRAALHGIEALVFFSWRPSRSGAEQYHSALLRHDGSPDRALSEAIQLAGELRAVPRAVLRRERAPVAVLWSADDEWAINIEPRRPGLTHLGLVTAAHAAARRLGLEVDVRHPSDDLTGYAAVLAPALQICNAERGARLGEALVAGTLVVLGVRSLVKDDDNCWVEMTLPAGLADDLGATIVASHATPAGATVEPFGVLAGPWCDVLEVNDSQARVVANYGGSDHIAGQPAAVVRGNLAYVGFSSIEAWAGVLRELLGERLPLEEVGPDGEVFMRDGHRIELDYAEMTVTGLPKTSA